MRRAWLPLVLLWIAQTSVAEVYKWVDDEGQVHYSDTPTATRSSERIELPESPDGHRVREAQERLELLLHAANQRAEARQRNKDQERLVAAEQQGAEGARNCIVAERNLRFLELDRPVYRTTPTGEREYLDDGAREAQIELEKAHIEEYCGR